MANIITIVMVNVFSQANTYVLWVDEKSYTVVTAHVVHKRCPRITHFQRHDEKIYLLVYYEYWLKINKL